MTNKIKTGIVAGLFSIGAVGLTSCAQPNKSDNSDENNKNKTEIVKHTPNDLLVKAAIDGNIDAVKDALSQGANPNFQNEQGQSVIISSLEQNSSLLHQGKALVVAEYMLDNTQIDVGLKDSNNKKFSDYVKEYVSKLQKLSNACASPSNLGTKMATEKVSGRWQKVLEKVLEKENKDNQTKATIDYQLIQKKQR